MCSPAGNRSISITAAKADQIIDEKCPKCESNLVIEQGPFGEFTACSSYPACKCVKQKTTGVLCPKDGGYIVERKSRRGNRHALICVRRKIDDGLTSQLPTAQRPTRKSKALRWSSTWGVGGWEFPGNWELEVGN